jgi:hypothetical protein
LVSTEKQAMFIKELQNSNCVIASEISFLLYCLPVRPTTEAIGCFYANEFKNESFLGSVIFHGR